MCWTHQRQSPSVRDQFGAKTRCVNQLFLMQWTGPEFSLHVPCLIPPSHVSWVLIIPCTSSFPSLCVDHPHAATLWGVPTVECLSLAVQTWICVHLLPDLKDFKLVRILRYFEQSVMRFHETSQFWVVRECCVSGFSIQNIDEQECWCWSDGIDHLGTGRFCLFEDGWRKLDVTELECWCALGTWLHLLLPAFWTVLYCRKNRQINPKFCWGKEKQRMGFWIWVYCQPSHPFSVLWKWLALGVLA